MANLAVEQKLQEQGHVSGAAPASAPNYVNLGGFAVSFEDLLQRVGARAAVPDFATSLKKPFFAIFLSLAGAVF